jgi:YD repeat-containing protein
MGGGGWNVVAPKNAGATLSLGTSSWTLTLKNGEQRQFNSATGRLIAIIDRNGNTTQLTYDTSDRLVTVTDAASRHLYFAYSGTSNTLVTSVASDVGLSLSYSYDNQGRLIKVTKPDQSTLSFEYNAQSLITVVRDADGKILESHTYDSFGRGLTSSRAGGVGSVTISYPNPPPKPAPPAMYVP